MLEMCHSVQSEHLDRLASQKFKMHEFLFDLEKKRGRKMLRTDGSLALEIPETSEKL